MPGGGAERYKLCYLIFQAKHLEHFRTSLKENFREDSIQQLSRELCSLNHIASNLAVQLKAPHGIPVVQHFRCRSCLLEMEAQPEHDSSVKEAHFE